MAKRRFSKTRSTSSSRKSKSPFSGVIVQRLLFAGLFMLCIYFFRDNLLRYLGFKSDKNSAQAKEIAEGRNSRIIGLHEDKVFGADISEYQNKIDWDNFGDIDGSYGVDFVFVRATVGDDRVDNHFRANWREAKRQEIMRGAYHYYRPNENSLDQAELFIKTVKLKKGDLPPVLDIEKLPRKQSLQDLKVGLRRWLDKVESHYHVKPIIYSGDSYYTDFLEKEFKGYTFWIANYTQEIEDIDSDWRFWQFTENASVTGIKGNVDLNIFNGSYSDLKELTID